MTNDMIHQNQFREFNSENLAVAIQNAFPILHQDIKRLKEELEKYVFPRLSFMAQDEKGSRLFLFENRYVETEWKDMIGIHYINTSYEVDNTVMRVHLFMNEEMQENDYVGCFTLRTINETQIMLSYIYPNWKYITYGDRALNVMTYRKKVHIKGREIVFHTYPLFVQDNAVIACAEACLVSMSKYLHSQYDYTRIHVRNINTSYHSRKNKIYPSQGLRPTQMLEVLYSHNIQCEYQVYYKQQEFKEYIDYCIESALPVLVGVHVESGDQSQEEQGHPGKNNTTGHVIQIIGHTDVETGKEYIVYDDSEYYLKSLGLSGFVGCVNWEKLSESLQDGKDFIIYPIHEKVYILYENLKKHVNDVLSRYKMGEGEKDEGVSCFGRTMLIDNRDVKKFLREKILENQTVSQDIYDEAFRLISMDMPHYLWCYECRTGDGYMLFFADPTYNRRTTKNIFINKNPLICENQIGLLSYD